MDLNEDGHLDILSGTYSVRGLDQMAGLFQILWGRGNGIFSEAETLKGSDGKPLYVKSPDRSSITKSICTRPFAVDWDHDGDLDLVAGNFAGTLYYYEGSGKGSFDPVPVEMKTGDGVAVLKINGIHSDPMVIDFDGDGDLDIVSGSSIANVQWAENNSADLRNPSLKQFRTLIENPFSDQYKKLSHRTGGSFTSLGESDLEGPAYATRIWVADYNSDGKLDVFAGDRVTLLQPAEGLSLEASQEKYAKWHADFSTISSRLNTVSRDSPEYAKAREDYSSLSQEKSRIVTENKTGLVWLYLQK